MASIIAYRVGQMLHLLDCLWFMFRGLVVILLRQRPQAKRPERRKKAGKA